MHTCFSQWQAYINTDTSDWIPHISLLLSLRSTATAAQTPGKWEAPTFFSFLPSLTETKVNRVWRRVGALDSSSQMKASQLLLAKAVTEILRKRELPSVTPHRPLHSLDRVCMKWVNIASLSSSIAIILEAMVGASPNIRLSATLPSASLRFLDKGVWEGDDTVTWKSSC